MKCYRDEVKIYDSLFNVPDTEDRGMQIAELSKTSFTLPETPLL